MNLNGLTGVSSARPGATEAQINTIEVKVGRNIPIEYRALLLLADGFSLQSGVIIYASDEILERNETFEVSKYAPGYLAIGDDSGGRSFMISFDRPGLFIVDQGTMDPGDMQEISQSLNDWISRGCMF